MSAAFEQVVFGNIAEVRTEIEISGDRTVLVGVYESSHGWVVEYLGGAEDTPGLRTEIEGAKERLRHYVNRRGLNAPEGLTAAGLALWLMEKDDGTAMGRRI
jgi:hypothetical protein